MQERYFKIYSLTKTGLETYGIFLTLKLFHLDIKDNLVCTSGSFKLSDPCYFDISLARHYTLVSLGQGFSWFEGEKISNSLTKKQDKTTTHVFGEGKKEITDP